MELFDERLDDMEESFKGHTFQIQSLQNRQMEYERKIGKIEEMAEMYEKKLVENTIIVTGLKIQHLSYARATSAPQNEHEDATASNRENVSLVTKNSSFFSEKGIDIPTTAISKAHHIGKPDPMPRILIQFNAQLYKIRVLSAKKLFTDYRPPIYMNEMLTKKAAEVFKYARNLRKENVIIATWTRNNSVFVRYTKNGQEFTRMIHSKQHLETISTVELRHSPKIPTQQSTPNRTQPPMFTPGFPRFPIVPDTQLRPNPPPNGRPTTRSVSNLSTNGRD